MYVGLRWLWIEASIDNDRQIENLWRWKKLYHIHRKFIEFDIFHSQMRFGRM